MDFIFISVTDAMVTPNGKQKTTNYGDESLTVLGRKTCNPFQQNIKSEIYFSNYKENIGIWFAPKCNAISAL